MIKKRTVTCAWLACILFCAVSCQKEETQEVPDTILPSVKEITFEAEGGTGEVITTGDTWRISGVFYPDGSPLYDNSGQLGLSGLGTLRYPGFRISRDSKTRLEITTDENFSQDKSREFILRLKDGEYTGQIVIQQKTSQGYQYRIGYTMGDGDGDSTLYNSSDFRGYNIINESSSDSKLGIFPYFLSVETSYFTSSDEAAFTWLAADSVNVPVPVSVENGKITTGGENYYYHPMRTLRETPLKRTKVMIDLPANKQVKVRGEIIYRQRKVTYTLTLKNNRTDEEKVITGKWIEKIPVDHRMEQSVGEIDPAQPATDVIH